MLFKVDKFAVQVDKFAVHVDKFAVQVDKFAVQVDKLVLSLLSSSNVANVANLLNHFAVQGGQVRGAGGQTGVYLPPGTYL